MSGVQSLVLRLLRRSAASLSFFRRPAPPAALLDKPYYVALANSLMATAAFSYLIVILVQTKMIWGVWKYRDLTFGDTSSYAFGAKRWLDHFQVDIVWSPLYTAFYGTFMMFSGDIYAATIAHRVAIVMLATVGVLAVMRQFLSGWLALLVAIWWAILPIHFETLYEVHLFSVLPVLCAWYIAAKFDTPAGRGAVVAILLATTLLVRNEYIVPLAGFSLYCLVVEWRNWRASKIFNSNLRRTVAAYATAIGTAVAVILFFLLRTPLSFDQIFAQLEVKHTLNMCQVYAFGYQQRVPGWTQSPWTECYGLMQETFGRRLPSFSHMMVANFSATLQHIAWNVSLVPSGLEASLFGVMHGSVSPDYLRIPQNTWVMLPSVLLVAITVCELVVIVRQPEVWWLREIKPRLSFWIILLATLAIAVPIIVTQRPRPSYLFTTTLVLVAIFAMALSALLRRQRYYLNVVSIAAALACLLVIPPYYRSHPSDRPLYNIYRTLEPHRSALVSTRGKLYIGDYSGEMVNYLWLQGIANTIDGDLSTLWNNQGTLDKFLRSRDVATIFLNSRVLASIENSILAAPLLSDPQSFGWTRIAPNETVSPRWLLLTRNDASNAP